MANSASTVSASHHGDGATRRDFLYLAAGAFAAVGAAASLWPFIHSMNPAADVLAMFDTTAWIGVRGVLDECPILPAALTAVLEGRTTPISPTAFEFISTTRQIGDVRVFMRTLPDLLSR